MLLVPIQRAHTYSNNPWIVVSEWHRCLAFERKGTAHFFIGGSDGAIITFKTSLVCPFRKAQVRLCGHSKEEAVKMGSLVILPLPALPLHLPWIRGFPDPGLLTLTSSITMETQLWQGNFLCGYYSDYKRIENRVRKTPRKFHCPFHLAIQAFSLDERTS